MRQIYQLLNSIATCSEHFGNAREMRNRLEGVVHNQSWRLLGSGQCDRDALANLLSENLPADHDQS